MNKVISWLLVVAIGLLLAFGASLYYTSTLFNEGLHARVSALNDQFQAPNIEVKFALEGDNRLLSADYVLTADIKRARSAPALAGQQIQFDIHVGYWPLFANHFVTLVDSELKANLKAAMNHVVEPFTADVSSYYNPLSQRLVSSGHLRIAEVDTELDGAATLTMAETGMDFDTDGTYVTTVSQFGPIKFVDGVSQFVLNRALIESAAETSEAFPNLNFPQESEAKFMLEKLYVLGPHGEGFSVGESSITFGSEINQDAFLFSVKGDVSNHVLLADEPTLPNIDRLVLQLGIELGAQAAKSANQQMRNLSPVQAQNPMLAIGAVDTFLSEGLKFSVDEFSLVTPSGNAEASLKAFLPAISMMQAMMAPDSAFEKIIADGQAAFDSELANYLPPDMVYSLLAMANQGLINEADGTLNSSFTMDKGAVIVNGIKLR